jgi:hypothetical protein
MRLPALSSRYPDIQGKSLWLFRFQDSGWAQDSPGTGIFSLLLTSCNFPETTTCKQALYVFQGIGMAMDRGRQGVQAQLHAFFSVSVINRYSMAMFLKQIGHMPVSLQNQSFMSSNTSHSEYGIHNCNTPGTPLLTVVARRTHPEGLIGNGCMVFPDFAHKPPDIQTGLPAGGATTTAYATLHTFQDIEILYNLLN